MDGRDTIWYGCGEKKKKKNWNAVYTVYDRSLQAELDQTNDLLAERIHDWDNRLEYLG